MRSLVLASIAVAATPLSARAGAGIRPDDLDKYDLAPSLVQRYAAPYLPALKACYVECAPTDAPGSLAVHLVIAHRGDVTILAVEAPGVRGASYLRLSTCIRNAARQWHFPVRSGKTEAVIPLEFHRLVVPGAGPQQGCTSPRGCPRTLRGRPPGAKKLRD